MPTPVSGEVITQALPVKDEILSDSGSGCSNCADYQTVEGERRREEPKGGKMPDVVGGDESRNVERGKKRIEYLNKCLKGRSRVCLEIPQEPEDHPLVAGTPRIGFCMDITQDVETGGYIVWLESITPPGSSGDDILKLMMFDAKGLSPRVAYVRGDKMKVVVNASKSLFDEEEELGVDESLQAASIIGEIIRSRSLDAGEDRGRWTGVL